MRAAVCRAFGSPLEIEDLRLAPPGPGDVRVRIAACAICHSDVSLADGAWGGELPAVYGHEASGVVQEVGASVTTARPGDRVVVSLLRSCGRCFFCARGEPHLCEHEFPGGQRLSTHDGEPVSQGLNTAAFAEEVVVDASQVAVVPDTVPLESAALIGCAVVTGFGAVAQRADVPVGASVVVLGTGGVGINCVQSAAIRGAAPVVAADISPAKREAAIRFGATVAIDPAGGELPAAIRDLTGGRGADYVFVTVGRAKVVEQGLACVRRGGTLVVVGMPPTRELVRIVAVDLAHNDIRILGSKMGSARLAEAVPQLVDLYREGKLKLDELVGGRYPFERINDALAAARDGEAFRNVVLFE
jgi:S-(hydroxymethyl)glutathione dehydrogenase/alcohol dehydrogenase